LISQADLGFREGEMKLVRWSALLVGVVVLAGCFPHPPPPPLHDTIVFVSDRTGNREIWSMRSDGSQQAQLTNSVETEFEPKLSSDGQQIAFVRKNASPNVFPDETIWVMDADGSNQHEVFAPAVPLGGQIPPNVTRDRDPTWSPDGKEIAFVRDALGTLAGVVAMNADGTGLHVAVSAVPPNQVDRVFDLAWSPDDTAIAYAFDFVCCLSHIDISKLDGSGTQILIGPRNAVDVQTFDVAPAWSPDSKKVAFHGQPNVNNNVGAAGVWVANTMGLPNPLQLAQDGQRPSWSPKGDRIAFDRAGSVWTMNADGTNQVLLTAGSSPSWGP
jgi:TolB protein